MNIGNQILNIRKENQLTQEEFGKLFHVTRQTVSNWENGKSYPDLQVSGKCLPSLDNFLILSRLLNTSIEDILVIDGDIPRFRSKYREIRERLNRWYNDKIVIL